MGQIGIWQILIVLVLVMLLFGRGKISELMGDVAKGIKSFKKGMADEESEQKAAQKAKTIEAAEAEKAAPADESATRTGPSTRSS